MCISDACGNLGEIGSQTLIVIVLGSDVQVASDVEGSFSRRLLSTIHDVRNSVLFDDSFIECWLVSTEAQVGPNLGDVVLALTVACG